VTYHKSFVGGNIIMVSTLCTNQYTKFEVSSFNNSKDMIGTKFLKNGYVTLTTPIRE